MVQITSVDFTVLRLSYLSYIPPKFPQVSLTKKKHCPSSSITLVRDWFERVMSKEKSLLPQNTNIRYNEWKVASGNRNHFKIHGFQYDRICIILGEESCYWIYYQEQPQHRRLEGSGMLPCAYCGCCLQDQYLNVLEAVKAVSVSQLLS